MNAVLPAFVRQLLEQGDDPGEIPEIAPSAAAGWLTRLASGLVRVVGRGSEGGAGSFLAQGYAHLPVAVDELPAHLRVSAHSGWELWQPLTTTVVLTVAGTLELEMYQELDDSLLGKPQYARAFGPEEAFAVHEGTLCATRSSTESLHLLVASQPTPPGGTPLTSDEFRMAAGRALRALEAVLRSSVGGDRW